MNRRNLAMSVSLLLVCAIMAVINVEPITDAAKRVSQTGHEFWVQGVQMMYVNDEAVYHPGGMVPRSVNDGGMDATIGKDYGEIIYNEADDKLYHYNTGPNELTPSASYWKVMTN